MAAPHSLPSSTSPSSSSSLPAAEKHWGVMLGGLISFKYMLPLPRTIVECVTGRPEALFEALRGCLTYHNDDVSGAAADLMKSFLFGLQRELRTFNSKDDAAKAAFVSGLLLPVSVYLLRFIDDLKESVLRLDVLSCRAQPLCGGFSTCCVMLRELLLIWPTVHSWRQGQGQGQGQGDTARTKSDTSIMLQGGLEGHSAAAVPRRSPPASPPKSISNTSTATPVRLDTEQGTSPLDVTVALTGLLSELLLKLLLYCKDSQHRCLLQLKSGTVQCSGSG
jgi:hypothetical protein